jgi:hypothetical protein
MIQHCQQYFHHCLVYICVLSSLALYYKCKSPSKTFQFIEVIVFLTKFVFNNFPQNLNKIYASLQ